MKTFKQIREEVAANNAGGGEIAGLGVGPQGEPGVPVAVQRRIRRKKGEHLLRRANPNG